MTLQGSGQPAYQVVDPATGDCYQGVRFAVRLEQVFLDAGLPHGSYLNVFATKCVLELGGVLAPDRPARCSPAVLVDVTEDMQAWHEELFGATVFSAEPERARRVAERTETGTANTNTPSMDAPELPFADDVRRSGFGRELTPGVSEFMNKRLVCTAVRAHV